MVGLQKNIENILLLHVCTPVHTVTVTILLAKNETSTKTLLKLLLQHHKPIHIHYFLAPRRLDRFLFPAALRSASCLS